MESYISLALYILIEAFGKVQVNVCFSTYRSCTRSASSVITLVQRSDDHCNVAFALSMSDGNYCYAFCLDKLFTSPHLISSQILAPYATHLHGVDNSAQMINEYNRLLASLETPQPRPVTTTTVFDLLDPSLEPSSLPTELSTEESYNFNLAAICLGFHHFEDTVLSASRMVERLKPGKGVLLIVDFLPHEKMGHGHGHHQHQHNHQVSRIT